MSPRVIAVRADATGRWYVHPDDEPEPISAHGSQTAAERAALSHAEQLADARVLVHDRYMRVRDVTARGRSAEPSAP